LPDRQSDPLIGSPPMLPGEQAPTVDRAAETVAVRGDREAGAGVWVAAVVVIAAVCRPLFERLLDHPAIAHWATIFVAITVQALPFLVLGVTVSALIAAFVRSGG